MDANADNFWSSKDFTKSTIGLTSTDVGKNNSLKEKVKHLFKLLQSIFREITVEPCLFIYMLCTAISSFAVQNMHLEKSCRVNYDYGKYICDRMKNRNTTGLEEEVKNVQSLVAEVIAWKFPLQTGIPAFMILFVGAWSDRTKKRKICILAPLIGEIITNIGLLLATYYFEQWSLETTALIEALPPAMSGSYIVMFMGMYSFMADITTLEDRTFRFGIVSIFVNLGTPAGTALSGILLRGIGYYGVFGLLLFLYCFSLFYGIIRLEDVLTNSEINSCREIQNKKCDKLLKLVVDPVVKTFMVVCKRRVHWRRLQIASTLVLYFLIVGPLYGKSFHI